MSDASSRRATRARHDALLLQDGVNGVDALADRVGVSASTVRRDLTRLQREAGRSSCRRDQAFTGPLTGADCAS
ncbi:DeoR family transcriptional regulator [Nocardioides iriomotensis]|uniref:DeoR family transcriptional regulator n=1 Tax=Nocardioides iriomotensis TaxID=715784 RepID=A0A4Q5J689_9ACTN|nr:DeoR family transcriptional regulator [Nocardioides iriomotensis]RYU13348.1 DeoR family transcriptional regulator [Nocardioides iriomotensis]